MATTSGRLALIAINAVARSGVRFSVIHAERELAEGSVTSDVDIVSDRPVHEVVRSAARAWADEGLWPLIVWPYDIGGTGSVFLSTADGTEGVQVDVLHDPNGRGQYGVKSSVLLANASQGERFQCVSPSTLNAYLVSKRLRKGQEGEVASIIEGVGQEALAKSISEAISEPLRSRILGYLEGQSFRRRRVPRFTRSLARLTRPIGAWVTVGGDHPESVARQLSDRFGRFVPHVKFVESTGIREWLTQIVPTRLRPGLVFSVAAETSSPPRPDFGVAGGVDEAATAVVQAVSGRNTHGR